MKSCRAFVAVLGLCAAWVVNAADVMNAFPPAETGQTRYVLNLPEAADENALQVELVVGKTERLDAGNRYFYSGSMEAVTVDGWGFTRYVVNSMGIMAGTLMAIDPNAPKVERFVTLGGEPYRIRYNSKLPVVVYVPIGSEVQYRIWRAGKLAAMPEG
jgi:ecotin